MTVDQAIQFSERAIQSARQRGDSQIRLITGTWGCFDLLSMKLIQFGILLCVYHLGKGLHSTDGIPKIKPAIEALMVKYVELNYLTSDKLADG